MARSPDVIVSEVLSMKSNWFDCMLKSVYSRSIVPRSIVTSAALVRSKVSPAVSVLTTDRALSDICISPIESIDALPPFTLSTLVVSMVNVCPVVMDTSPLVTVVTLVVVCMEPVIASTVRLPFKMATVLFVKFTSASALIIAP